MEDIKKSFRRLAHEFHPDKNPDNVFAEARFREIHEAYTVLSHEERRALYDYERWLSGRFTRQAAILTPAYLLQEVQKLNAHIAEIDVYRMNKELLHQYLMFLFSDEKIAIIQLKADTDTVNALVAAIMQTVAVLPHYFALAVLQRLKETTAAYPYESKRIDLMINKRRREAQWQRLFPWLALLVTLLLCLAMYLFSKK